MSCPPGHNPLPPVYPRPFEATERPPPSDGENDEKSKDEPAGDNDDPKVEAGMRSEVKNLYEGHPKCSCCVNWVEELPKETLDSINASKVIREFAIVVRQKREKSALEGELKLDSIVVQSPLLKPFLKEVFAGLTGVVCTLEKLEFNAPFSPFFHRWAEFKQARSLCDGETRAHVDLLYEALKDQVEKDIQACSDLVAHNVITFDYLWTLFSPGDLAICRQDGEESACLVTKPDYYKDPDTKDITAYTIIGRYIDVARLGLGYATSLLAIKKFKGTTPISELVFQDAQDRASDTPVFVIPAHMRSDFGTLKDALIKRGRKFESLQGYHFKQYDADVIVSIQSMQKEIKVKHRVSSRIVVDAEAFESHKYAQQSNLLPLDADILEQEAFETDSYMYGDPGYLTTERKIQHRLLTLKREKRPLTEDQLLLCSPKVKGFVMKSKTWGEFFVDQIEDIEFHKDAFKSIVLPENYKDLITSFVTRHMSKKNGFDDVIPGKGRGLIILLSGEPGVGKTLTAESVAEEMQAPLYALGAGELGSEAHRVDSKLEDVFDLCTRWKAVLLLDEADVFLEQRTMADMERNKIVSVFLRVLEYYQGMMFMTTNRVSAFDAAFRSRIHINMDYPPLNTAARKAVWSKFLQLPAVESVITEQEITALAEKTMNGREIKNSIKIASLLAEHKDEKLNMGHLKTVLMVNGFGTEGGYVLENDFRVASGF